MNFVETYNVIKFNINNNLPVTTYIDAIISENILMFEELCDICFLLETNKIFHKNFMTYMIKQKIEKDKNKEPINFPVLLKCINWYKLKNNNEPIISISNMLKCINEKYELEKKS